MPLQEDNPKSSPSRFLACVVLTRLLEAAWGGAVLGAGLLLENAAEPFLVDKWKYWTFFNLAETIGIVIVWYYVGFGYLIADAAALFLARHRWGNLKARQYTALNVAVFAVHSIIIVILVFHASLTLPFWFAWIAMILFNCLVPRELWRRLCSSDEKAA